MEALAQVLLHLGLNGAKGREQCGFRCVGEQPLVDRPRCEVLGPADDVDHALEGDRDGLEIRLALELLQRPGAAPDG